MNIGAWKRILAKLAGRSITVQDCWEAMKNRHGKTLEDVRANNRTVPPTYWVIGDTDSGRLLKFAFVYDFSDRSYIIKSAYEPDQLEIDFYRKNAMSWQKHIYNNI